MKTVKLGHTNQHVSRLCLGTMYFGTAIAEDQSYKLLNLYLENGGNFLDTANNYAFWIDGFQGGESEQLLGRWMKAQGNRDDLFIATKVGFNMPPRVPISLSQETIIKYCEQSLANLQTDCIDLYYAHTDDRNTPLEETLGAFDEIIQAGKVRYIGLSNTLAWRIKQALSVSEQKHWAQYCCLQQRDSYLKPKADVLAFGNGHVPVTPEIEDFASAQDDFTIVAYSVLIGGVYSSENGEIPEYCQPHLYDTDLNQRKLAMVREIANEIGASTNQVVIAWLLQNRANKIALVSSSSLERLQENLNADNLTLADEHLTRLNAVH